MNPLTGLQLRLASIKAGAILRDMAASAGTIAENIADEDTKGDCAGILMGIREICRILGDDVKNDVSLDEAAAMAEGALSEMFDRKKPKKD